ncbi:MAG: hypothetical protein WBL05_05790 [Brooklawnia sp.]|uniref:hypothetical protein n=1 Tax=Brooklawnia sp. TaxID=2699740 RepID=UPI003C784DCF
MAEVSEVQNLDPDDNVPVDETPPASDTQHVSQGEPRDYTGPFEEDREYFSDSDTPHIP